MISTRINSFGLTERPYNMLYLYSDKYNLKLCSVIRLCDAGNSYKYNVSETKDDGAKPWEHTGTYNNRVIRLVPSRKFFTDKENATTVDDAGDEPFNTRMTKK